MGWFIRKNEESVLSRSGDLGQDALFVLLLALIAGCTAEDRVQSQVARSPRFYIEQSCAFTSEQGDGEAISVRPPRIRLSYFGKPYDREWLARVGHLSMKMTSSVIESTGANVYVSGAYTERSCKNLGFNRTLPADLSTRWDEIEEFYRESIIGGVYFAQDGGGASLFQAAAIIVREDASRWTLVHEFMHHNFHAHAKVANVSNEESLSERNELEKKIRVLNLAEGITPEERLKEQSHAFLALVDVTDRRMIGLQLEEVAVEATLQDSYDSGDLTFVSPGSYANAGWYIEQSRRGIVALYASLDGLYDRLHDQAELLNLKIERSELERYQKIRERRLSELDSVMSSHRAKDSPNQWAFSAAAHSEKRPFPRVAEMPCLDAAARASDLAWVTEQLRKIRFQN
ncbi:MAG: hypothetical protein H7301_04815 [Cryobacterium sp.]|nr:hypothetical protein [Oligoflexia bacterium]